MEITEQNYVAKAEQVINELRKKRNLTTTKLRNLLSMTADIYNAALAERDEKLSAEVCSRIEYLRVRFLYEAGREETVGELVEKAEILNMLKEIKGSRKRFILFNRYMEALVAFHRYYGGKD